MKRTQFLACLAAVALTACIDDTKPTNDDDPSPQDGAAQLDFGSDGGRATDAGPDVAPDVAADVAADVAPDASPLTPGGFVMLTEEEFSPTESVVVQASLALDPESVDDQTVVLASEYGGRIDGEVSYDAERGELTFDPRFALPAGRRFEISIDGVRSADGEAVEIFLDSRGVRPLRPRIAIRAIGGSDRGTLYRYDPSNTLTSIWTALTPGPDEIWGTEDDVWTRIETRTPTDEGLEIRTYENDGPDERWGTEDDEQSGLVRYQHDAYGQLTVLLYYGEPGEGQAWGAPEHRPLGGVEFEYDEYGRLSSRQDIGPGPDGQFGNADDELTVLRTYAYDAAHTAATYQVTSAGPDGEWSTADDGYAVDNEATFGPDGRIERRTSYSAFSDEREIRGIEVFESDADDGRARRIDSFTDPGDDGRWETPDDVGDFREEYEFRDDGTLGEWRTIGSGADRRFGTEDDQVSASAEYQ